MAARLAMTLTRAGGGSAASRACTDRISAARSRWSRGSGTSAPPSAVGAPAAVAREALIVDSPPDPERAAGRRVLPIHTPTATLATTAAAASQRGGTARARTVRGCAAGALLRSALIRASICGHRSRTGSIAGDSSRSELTLRSSALPVPLMSAHLHIQSLAQQFPRPVQLGLARALRHTQHLGRLPVRVTIHRVQHQRIARAIGQRADRGLDLLHFHRRLECPLECTAPALLVLETRLHG